MDDDLCWTWSIGRIVVGGRQAEVGAEAFDAGFERRVEEGVFVLRLLVDQGFQSLGQVLGLVAFVFGPDEGRDRAVLVGVQLGEEAVDLSDNGVA